MTKQQLKALQLEAWNSWQKYSANAPNNLVPNPNSYIVGYIQAVKEIKK